MGGAIEQVNKCSPIGSSRVCLMIRVVFLSRGSPGSTTRAGHPEKRCFTVKPHLEEAALGDSTLNGQLGLGCLGQAAPQFPFPHPSSQTPTRTLNLTTHVHSHFQLPVAKLIDSDHSFIVVCFYSSLQSELIVATRWPPRPRSPSPTAPSAPFVLCVTLMIYRLPHPS